ncbi:MAG: D-aminoacylase [Deltaproteobacteria bacterium]|nr:MAG: D-aminoacylase [Deltaproteobacteria bacterium]
MIALLCAAVFDLILSGGRVMDGTGAPWFRADVGIRGDTIAAVGDLSRSKARRRIQLKDLALAPGFIDLLGQSELNALIDPREESKVRQGITTELTGEGVSPAPMNAAWIHEQAPWLRKYRLKIDWTDLSGYFRRLQKARPSINEALLVGAGQVRGIVLGFKDVQPDEKQLARMQKLVDAAMRQGAFGVSTGLIYQPGSFARTPELIALAKIAARHRGIYATHIRSESKKIGEALEEAFTIAREARVPVEIWHLKVSGRANWGRMKEVIGRIEAARAAGLDVTADMYPWIASANGLDASIPDWAHEGGVDAMVARIRDPAQRAKMIREIETELHAEDILLLSAVNPEVKKHVGKRLDAAARDMGKTPAEALVDLVAMDRANVGVARFGMSEEDVRLGLSQPWVAMDTDYGAMAIDGPFAAEGSAHPRAFASTARILGHYARDERLFSMEEAVRKMTSLPARRLGLQDRGLIRAGMKADLVAFDPATVRDTASFEKPMAYPEGIPYLVVNGKIVLDNGRRTRERPGRPLRHSP